MVFSGLDRLRCHLTGDEAICKGGVDGKGNGGVGPCLNVSEEISDEFIEIVRARQALIQAKKDAKAKAKKISEGVKAVRRVQAQQAGEERTRTSAPARPLLAYHTPTGGVGATYKTQFGTAVSV